MASRSDLIEKEVPKDFFWDFFWSKSNRIDLKWGSLSMVWSHWANVPEAIHRCLGNIDDHQRGYKSWTSTGGDRGNSRAHGYRP